MNVSKRLKCRIDTIGGKYKRMLNMLKWYVDNIKTYHPDLKLSLTNPHPWAAYKELTCDCCGHMGATESLKKEAIPFGEGKDEIIINAYVPVITCHCCEMEYTDTRGEALRAAAVDAYVKLRGGVDE